MKAEIWDNRQCRLGEGPIAIGPSRSDVRWVDIYNSKVLSRNLDTGQTSEYSMPEHVSFVIPCTDGSEILGITNGPVRRRADGSIEKLPTRQDADGKADSFPTRWNDAKVAPDGHLWLGTMPYEIDQHPFACALYKLNKDTLKLTKEVSQIGLSNGLAWSKDGKVMYYIDTMTNSIDTFDYQDGKVSNRKSRWKADASQGLPDGMCIDQEDGIWVAFWGGSVVRRFDKNFNITDEIQTSAPFTTSCAFAGKNLDKLIITSAHNEDAGAKEDWGKTFIYSPKVPGTPTVLFPN